MRPGPGDGGATKKNGGIVNHHYVTSTENPPFDPRGYIKTHPWGKLRRGRMVEENPLEGATDLRRLRFLFNPSEIDVSYDLTSAPDVPPTLPASMDRSGADQLMGNSGSLSFSLFFDRTYELWDRKYKDNFIYQRGCEVDLSMLKQMLNIDTDLGLGQQGVPIFKTFYIFFGGTTAPAYYGWVNSISLVYAHFTQNMVPVRANVSIGVTLLPTEKNSPVYDPTYAGFADTAATYGHIYDPYSNDARAVGY